MDFRKPISRSLNKDNKSTFSAGCLEGPLGMDTKVYILSKQKVLTSAVDHIFLYGIKNE